MSFFARRRFRKWAKRSRPHLEQLNRHLDVITTANATNLVAVGDQLDSAVDALSDYLLADPCPMPELAGAYACVVLIIGGVADVFAIWHRLAPPEQQAAVERTHQLGIQAEAIAGVLAPQARCTFDGACGVCS